MSNFKLYLFELALYSYFRPYTPKERAFLERFTRDPAMRRRWIRVRNAVWRNIVMALRQH